MKINDWLREATSQLVAAGISTARLDCLVLLEDTTGKDRGWLLAHPEFELSVHVIEQLKSMILRRAQQVPLAYIRGKSEFYGREFVVNPATLQPRPETETMLELLADCIESKKLKDTSVVDVGTGSGAIAITAKLEHPELVVYATEINQDALGVARQNSKTLGADIKFYQGNLLEPLKNHLANSEYLVILANLPYVPDTHTINSSAMQEPQVAIFGGPDGLDLYRGLFSQIKTLAVSPQLILTESLPFQHTQLARIASENGYSLQQTDDFIQCFRTNG